MRRSDIVLSYNDVEHSVITSHTDGAVKVVKCPWVVELPDTIPPLSERAGISFLGNYAHHPNAEAVEWFVREVVPLLAEHGEAAAFSIYGSGATDEIRALAGPGVVPVGYVAAAAEAYDRHRVFVAPLLSGAGIKGKVLAALAHGIPCVLSPVAAEGVGLRNRHDCLIAKTPEEWHQAIGALLSDDAMWQSISDNGRDFMAEDYSFERGRALMRDAFESVGLFGR